VYVQVCVELVLPLMMLTPRDSETAPADLKSRKEGAKNWRPSASDKVKETSNDVPNTTSLASILETNVGDWAANGKANPKEKATTTHLKKGI
jgi:hypothetical protein